MANVRDTDQSFLPEQGELHKEMYGLDGMLKALHNFGIKLPKTPFIIDLG